MQIDTHEAILIVHYYGDVGSFDWYDLFHSFEHQQEFFDGYILTKKQQILSYTLHTSIINNWMYILHMFEEAYGESQLNTEGGYWFGQT